MNELDIFSTALEIESPEERSKYLEEACGQDDRLRDRILALLASSEKEDSFMESASVAPTMDSQPITEKTGTQIGPYKLLQELGEGGMGVVYMAEQMEPVQRRVALKIIKPGMDTRQVIARFEAERQALAMMDHPNIAKVLDAGTTRSGRPYFVMELVNGISITRYCDEQHLTPKERLELFVPVCHAIQHAHQKGIIHRDVKPSNVLIALYDGKAVPKVIDFGVAKATQQNLTEKTLFTQLGQVVGTLEYMSPEQAERNQLDIDTRSDVYSLGVLLYELLTGTTPLEKERLRSASFDEMLRMIREEEPPRPSMRLSTVETLPSIAANRRIEPRKLRTLVRGELDWVVMKALEKDRVRRYETASSLAADIDRFLNNDAVQACPPSVAYRVRKFVRRHRIPVAVASVLLLMLCLGLAGTTVGFLRVRIAERKASAEQERASELAAQNGRLAEDERRARQDAEKSAQEEQRARREAERSLYISDMNRIRFEWENNNVARTRELVDLYRSSDLRGWEWHYWDRTCHAELRSLSSSPVHRLAVNPNGPIIASAELEGDSEAIRIRDLVSGKELRTLHVHEGKSDQLAFSRDGRFLASCDATYRVAETRRNLVTVRLWEMPSGNELQIVEVPTNASDPCFALSPDGTILAVSEGEDADSIRLWDTIAQKWLKSLPTASGVRCLEYSPQGLLGVACSDGIHLWDALRGELPHLLIGHESVGKGGTVESVNTMDFSPDGKTLASSGKDGTIKLWDVASGRQLRILHAATQVDDVAFSPDGKQLISACRDGSLILWDSELGFISDIAISLAAGRKLRTYRGHEMRRNDRACAAFSSDGIRLVSSASDGIRVWDATAGPVEIGFGPSSQFAFSGDGARLAIRRYYQVAVIDVTSGGRISLLDRPNSSVRDVTFNPLNEVIATAEWHQGSDSGIDSSIDYWDSTTGRLINSVSSGSEIPSQLAFSSDGETLASVWVPRRQENKGNVKLWRAGTDQQLRAFDGKYAAFSPVGKLLAIVGINNNLTILNLETGDQLVIESDQSGTAAFSPDGKRVAFAGTIWSTTTGELICTVGDGELEIVFSEDGKRLFSLHTLTDARGEVRVWDASNGSLLCPIQLAAAYGPGSSRDRLALSSDGWRCAVTGRLGAMMLDVRPLTSHALRVEREARNLVVHLLYTPMLVDDLTAAINSMTSISEAVKREALSFAKVQGSVDASYLNDASFNVVSQRGLDKEQYRRALRWSEEANRLLPAVFRGAKNTFGMALYRTGNYERAISMLHESMEEMGENQIDLCFIAMAQYKLGKEVAARATLSKARNTKLHSRYAQYLSEAEEVIEGETTAEK